MQIYEELVARGLIAQVTNEEGFTPNGGCPVGCDGSCTRYRARVFRRSMLSSTRRGGQRELSVNIRW